MLLKLNTDIAEKDANLTKIVVLTLRSYPYIKTKKQGIKQKK